jgi:hypothetical protein
LKAIVETLRVSRREQADLRLERSVRVRSSLENSGTWLASIFPFDVVTLDETKRNNSIT